MPDAAINAAYTSILKEELIPALGCTEPIAVAYAGALSRKTLGKMPEEVILTVSGNIVKNVKSVIVPHTRGRKGLRTAVSAGICFGDPNKELEVLSDPTSEELENLDAFLNTARISIENSTSHTPFDIQVTLKAGNEESFVRIAGDHTNVVSIRKNGETLLEKPFSDEEVQVRENRELLNIEDIVAYAGEVDLDDVREVLERQIDFNLAIARAGMEGHYGAEIGRILIRSYGNSVQNRAKAWAAAGSDARMNGCELPVVINSGSGNQGITASIPVIIYARECNVSQDLLLRALLISNLVTIHLKSGIGSLSAYCGATSAGAGAGAGICYLYGGNTEDISHTIINALAINSGMICDGAKASCAAKIASAVEAGLLGMQMSIHDSQFYSGDGIVVEGVENTIRAVSTIAREGMKDTDSKILHIMMENGD